MRFLRFLKYTAIAVLISAAGFAGAALAIYLLLPGFSDRLPLARPQPTPTRLDQVDPDTATLVITDQDAILQALRRVAPSLVTVTDGPVNAAVAQPSPVGVSGFLFDPRGYVLTSQHAVAGFKSFRVTLADDRAFGAKLLGSHRSADLAVLKLNSDSENFAAVAQGDSCLLQTGEWVVAVGSPSPAAEHTASVGVVCANSFPAAADARAYDHLIQADVRLNAHNTGGPLLNLTGEVVGVCTNVYTDAAKTTSLGYALPIADAFTLADEIIRNGRTTTTYLGLSVEDASEADAAAFHLHSRSGALIRGILPGGPAGKAGLQRHDLVTRFDGQLVRSAEGLLRLARKQPAGKQVTVEFWREGNKLSKQIQVEERK